jgi:hypothetical protein
MNFEELHSYLIGNIMFERSVKLGQGQSNHWAEISELVPRETWQELMNLTDMEQSGLDKGRRQKGK